VAVIAFVSHPERKDAEVLADQAEAWLVSRGHIVRQAGGCIGAVPVALGTPTTTVDSPGKDGVGVGGVGGTDSVVAAAIAGADLVVSLGGDGTMLCTTALATRAGVPVLGVNLGRLGYLTEVEPDKLESALERFLAGDYRVEHRCTLEVTVERDGTERGPTYLAVNEAVVEKTVPGHTIRVVTALSGLPFITFAADGLLVATPTGSTAYNLSARGPILSPGLEAMVLTPISPHQLFDHSLVLQRDEVITLELAGPRPAVLVVDGAVVDNLEPGDLVECRVGIGTAKLVTFGRRDFHSVLRARFHPADR
jgi:NAD+ kinase